MLNIINVFAFLFVFCLFVAFSFFFIIIIIRLFFFLIVNIPSCKISISLPPVRWLVGPDIGSRLSLMWGLLLLNMNLRMLFELGFGDIIKVPTVCCACQHQQLLDLSEVGTVEHEIAKNRCR
jgi:hypothetical protein